MQAGRPTRAEPSAKRPPAARPLRADIVEKLRKSHSPKSTRRTFWSSAAAYCHLQGSAEGRRLVVASAARPLALFSICAPASLRNFGRPPKKSFSTISALSGNPTGAFLSNRRQRQQDVGIPSAIETERLVPSGRRARQARLLVSLPRSSISVLGACRLGRACPRQ